MNDQKKELHDLIELALNATDVEAAIKSIKGTARSMGIEVTA